MQAPIASNEPNRYAVDGSFAPPRGFGAASGQPLTLGEPVAPGGGRVGSTSAASLSFQGACHDPITSEAHGRPRGLQLRVDHDSRLRARSRRTRRALLEVFRPAGPGADSLLPALPHARTQAGCEDFFSDRARVAFFYETTLGRRWVSDSIAYPRQERRVPTVLGGVMNHLSICRPAVWPAHRGTGARLGPYMLPAGDVRSATVQPSYGAGARFASGLPRRSMTYSGYQTRALPERPEARWR